jgi:predicted ATPase
VGQLVSPSIVGREAELADLGEALAAARDGNGRVVIISGEAGIGKSRLAREVTERAREAGMKVLVGRAAQTGTPVPYRPFAEAIQSSLRKVAEIQEPSLDPYRRALRRLLAEVDDGPLSEEDVSPLVLMEGLLRLLAVTAGEAGLLLLLEDLHWADAETLAVVEYLADHLDSVGAACLCTERTDSGDAAAELIGSLSARRAVERMVLTPLSDGEVSSMAGLILGDEDVPAGVVQALVVRAGGVPFLVEETLAAYLAAGGRPSARPSGGSRARSPRRSLPPIARWWRSALLRSMTTPGAW